MKSLYEAMTTVAPFLIKQKVFSSRNHQLTVTPLMFYDLKRNTSLQIEGFYKADMLVFRKSIFGGALNYISIWSYMAKNSAKELLFARECNETSIAGGEKALTHSLTRFCKLYTSYMVIIMYPKPHSWR